jgi:hypothetical protein
MNAFSATESTFNPSLGQSQKPLSFMPQELHLLYVSDGMFLLGLDFCDLRLWFAWFG